MKTQMPFKPLPCALVLAMLILVMQSCKHEVRVPGTPGNVPDTTGGGNDTSGGLALVCFEGEVLPIFTSNCAKSGCHDVASSQDGYILNTYSNIINANKDGIRAGDLKNSKIYKAITENDPGDRMPQGQPPLSDAQIALIKKWILEGAKNTTNCTTTCSATNFTYSAAIKPLVEKNCKGCHSGSAPSGGLDFSTYAGLQTVALNGKLTGAINHVAGFPPCPRALPN